MEIEIKPMDMDVVNVNEETIRIFPARSVMGVFL